MTLDTTCPRCANERCLCARPEPAGTIRLYEADPKPIYPTPAVAPFNVCLTCYVCVPHGRIDDHYAAVHPEPK